jgi:hypothetical protein
VLHAATKEEGTKEKNRGGASYRIEMKYVTIFN